MLFAEFVFRLFALRIRQHLQVIGLFTLLVCVLSSSLMVSESIRHTSLQTLAGQPDLIVQRHRGGRAVEVPLVWSEKLGAIPGVAGAVGRVYGYYDFEVANKRFLIVGLNLFSEESMQDLRSVAEGIDLKSFFSEPSMLVGAGVKEILSEHSYTDHMNFILPSGNLLRMKIMGTPKAELAQFGEDVIFMPAPYARDLLGLKESQASDLALVVPNAGERLLIASKVRELYPDARVIEKGYLESRLTRRIDHRSGLFLALYISVILSFFILLFHKAGALTPHERKEIAILRAVGWSIGDVIGLKLIEGLYTALVSFLLGFVLAYAWVFLAGAPLLREIFLGGENLESSFALEPHIAPYLVVSLLLFSVIPYTLAVVYPAWRAAVTDIHEALR